jgi:acetyltransferase
MSVRNLNFLFNPRSVAVLGASDRPKAVGMLVMRNLLQGGFKGPIMPINPNRQAVSGVLAYPDVKSLPITPDLAVICTPPQTVPGLIDELGKRGTRAAIVLTAGLSANKLDNDGRSIQQALLDTARSYQMRILGPNCLGLLVPGVGLNASFAHQPALPGKIAFVSQSGALCTAVLDWAAPKGIGFSHFISLGDCADLDFGDVLDYLGSDPNTRAILLYIESIHERRNFMSAARAAARNKPVLAIKSGRVAEGAKAAASHTGALAGADAVYDAAIRRAGMLRVFEIDELFAAVETLARSRPSKGSRLAIITNGGGIGVMAVDDLIEGKGQLAELSPETVEALDKVLPATWSRGNPVDIIGDAPGERYVKALEILFKAPEIDAVLCMHAPTAVSSATEVAESVIELAKKSKNNLMTCWVGEGAVAHARKLFNEAGVPTYDTPSQAVRAFLHVLRYRQNQVMLMETPPSAPVEFTPATATARLVVENAIANGHTVMSEPEAKAVLAAYGIPTVETHIARTPADASRLTRDMGGGRVALKILSPEISHKSDVGGVILDIDGPFEVEKAAHAMLERVSKVMPNAHVTGFTVQEMARRPGAHELIIGVTTDPIFGPVLLFGQGGTAVEVIGDRAVALPPLNMALARDLISQTRIFNLLKGYRDRPAANLDAICLTLMQVAQLVIDIPEIVELDINPLFADANGVLALDARIKVATTSVLGTERLAIRPYPKELEETITAKDGRKILMRPIRPEDEPNHHIFVSKLTPEDIRFRFFGLIEELPHSEMARLTQIDYDREMAFIATAHDEHGLPETLGVVRTVTDPNNEKAEFAVAVRSDLKGQGLGVMLMNKIIRYSKSRGTRQLVGQVLSDNRRMMKMIEGLGFKRGAYLEGDIVEVSLTL